MLTPINIALIAVAMIALVVLRRMKKKTTPTGAKATTVKAPRAVKSRRPSRGRRGKRVAAAAESATAFAALMEHASPDESPHVAETDETATLMSAPQPLAVPWSAPEPISAPGWPGCDDGEWAGLFDDNDGSNINSNELMLSEPSFVMRTSAPAIALAEVAAADAVETPAPTEVALEAWDAADAGFDLATGWGAADAPAGDDVAATLVEESPLAAPTLADWTFEHADTIDTAGGLTLET